jgi:hypothetical protein
MINMAPVFVKNEFRKAKSCDGPGGGCVVIARGAGWVEMRDSKTDFGATDDYRLIFTDEQFDAYLMGVRSGDTEGLALNVTLRSDGMYVFRNVDPKTDASPDVELVFNEGEIEAFHDGVAKYEFDLPVAV